MIASQLNGTHLGQWLAVGDKEFQIGTVIHSGDIVSVLLDMYGWLELDPADPVTLYELRRGKVDHLVLAEPQQYDLFGETS